MALSIGGLSISAPQHASTPASGPSVAHDVGQLFGHALNALPGYSTLGANITNPNINYLGVPNPGHAQAAAPISNSSVPSPQPDASGIYTGGSGTGGAGGGADPNIQAYQDQITSLNQLLGNADINMNNGQSAINTGYNNSLNQLQGNNQNVLNQYGTQDNNTKGDYSKALNTINANARNGYNNLMQLLGGTGSAGNVLAPFAVSVQANQQRQGSSDAFAKNEQAIQDAIAAANQNYNNQKKSLEGQKNTQLQNLLSSINQQKIGYQQQIAADQNQLNLAKGGGYQTPTVSNDVIQQLLAQQQQSAQQYAQPTFSVQDYVAPQTNLASYQSQAAQLAQDSNGSGNTATDTGGLDPTGALAALLKQTDNTNTNAYSY